MSASARTPSGVTADDREENQELAGLRARVTRTPTQPKRTPSTTPVAFERPLRPMMSRATKIGHIAKTKRNKTASPKTTTVDTGDLR